MFSYSCYGPKCTRFPRRCTHYDRILYPTPKANSYKAFLWIKETRLFVPQTPEEAVQHKIDNPKIYDPLRPNRAKDKAYMPQKAIDKKPLKKEKANVKEKKLTVGKDSNIPQQVDNKTSANNSAKGLRTRHEDEKVAKTSKRPMIDAIETENTSPASQNTRIFSSDSTVLQNIQSDIQPTSKKPVYGFPETYNFPKINYFTPLHELYTLPKDIRDYLTVDFINRPIQCFWDDNTTEEEKAFDRALHAHHTANSVALKNLSTILNTVSVSRSAGQISSASAVPILRVDRFELKGNAT